MKTLHIRNTNKREYYIYSLYTYIQVIYVYGKLYIHFFKISLNKIDRPLAT